MEVFLGTKEQDGSTALLHGADRRKHCAIFGKSGVGKTTLYDRTGDEITLDEVERIAI